MAKTVNTLGKTLKEQWETAMSAYINSIKECTAEIKKRSDESKYDANILEEMGDVEEYHYAMSIIESSNTSIDAAETIDRRLDDMFEEIKRLIENLEDE